MIEGTGLLLRQSCLTEHHRRQSLDHDTLCQGPVPSQPNSCHFFTSYGSPAARDPFPPNNPSSKVSWEGANSFFREPFQNQQRESRLHTATLRGTQPESKVPAWETAGAQDKPRGPGSQTHLCCEISPPGKSLTRI